MGASRATGRSAEADDRVLQKTAERSDVVTDAAAAWEYRSPDSCPVSGRMATWSPVGQFAPVPPAWNRPGFADLAWCPFAVQECRFRQSCSPDLCPWCSRRGI